MICVDREKRIKARDILKHPWIVNNVTVEKVDHHDHDHAEGEGNMLKCMQTFKGRSELKR
jgi:hypothetical protein